MLREVLFLKSRLSKARFFGNTFPVVGNAIKIPHKMTDEIKTNFENVFKTLFKNKKIIFPTEDISKNWTKVLNEWIDDDQMILFVRKGGETRGQIFETSCGRKIMTTDNTPAHWVFKNIVLNGLNHSKKEISELKVGS